MNRFYFTFLVLLVALMAWTLRHGTTLAAPSAATRMMITEIAPVAGADAPASVEFYVLSAPAAAHTLYLPIVHGPGATTGGRASTLPTNRAAALDGWHFTNGEGQRYAFPDGLALPEGTHVLVYLTTGTDETDPADGLVTLYAGDWGATPFAPEGDIITLYREAVASPEAVADVVAWGRAPGDAAADAIAAEKWEPGVFIFFDAGFGAEGFASPPRPGDALGRWHGQWFPYYASVSTPGMLNEPPRPTEWLTPNGTTLERDTFAVAWSPLDLEDAQYDFQFATTATFDAPLVDTTLDHAGWAPDVALEDGTYFWRARLRLPEGPMGTWWGPFEVESQSLDISIGVMRTTMDPEFYQIQHKDTALLEIGGGSKNSWWDEEKEQWFTKGLWREQIVDGIPSLRSVWDHEHVFPNGVRSYNSSNSFDNYYCARATASMLNHVYGGSLSQDRISYYMFEENSDNDYTGRPEGDFGFRSGANMTTAVEYALGIEMDAHNFCPDPDGTYNEDETIRCALNPAPNAPVTITWEEVTSELDKGEPLAFSSSKHAFIISGYWQYQGEDWVQLFDPAPKTCTEEGCGGPTWRKFDELDSFLVTYLAIPDGVTPEPRDDEGSIGRDSDGDGVMDFDEIVRFDTDPENADSDGDWLGDKEEIASYTFRFDGKYNRPWGPDFDRDGLRMEVDWDNDNDHVADGCEDRNLDGRLDFVDGESSNFHTVNPIICIPRLTLRAPTTATPAEAGTYEVPHTITVVVDVAYPTPMGTPNYQQNAFSVTIGGLSSVILGKNQEGTRVFLTVQPPAQPAPGLRDLTVTYASPAGPQQASASASVNYTPVPQ